MTHIDVDAIRARHSKANDAALALQPIDDRALDIIASIDDIPTLLSALEAANTRADEAEVPMSKDKRAEIVEAMASRLRTNKREGYETTLSDKALCGELADIALKAAAEIARRFQCGECDIGGPAVAYDAILALTSKGVKT